MHRVDGACRPWSGGSTWLRRWRPSSSNDMPEVRASWWVHSEQPAPWPGRLHFLAPLCWGNSCYECDVTSATDGLGDLDLPGAARSVTAPSRHLARAPSSWGCVPAASGMGPPAPSGDGRD